MVHHSDDDDSDDNATGSSSGAEEQRRRSTSTSRSRSKKKDRKHSRSSSKKSDRKKPKKRSRKDEKRRDYSSDDNGIDEDAASMSSREDRRKRRKRDKKEKRGGGGKHHRKHHHRKQSDDEQQQGSNHNSELLERNYALADALCQLLEHHPALAADLPILLIRLCGGTTFDFSQMSVPGAAHGLNAVFAALRPFGVMLQQEQEVGGSSSGTWMWKNPAGMAAAAGSELTLIRVVRALLDQIGVTVPAIEEFENPSKPSANAVVTVKEKQKHKSTVHNDNDGGGDHRGNDENVIIEQQTTNLLLQFGTSDLAKELAGLCSMILEGESIALDGLPNEQLRKGLEALFENCGLVLCEMEESSDDDDDKDDKKDIEDAPAKGYGLPESSDRKAKAMLQSILQVCENAVAAPSSVKPVIKGPMLPPKDYEEEVESSDDEGPLPAGASKVKAVSTEVVKAKAARRARELECAKHGVEFDATVEGNAREEWMLVPGKFDFLSAIKSGQPIRSRQFDGKTRGDAGASEKAVDPKIQAEIRSIRQAHEDLRGPSLMEQHRAMKQQEAEEKQKQGKESWKWNRDKDLDAGRRVDKDALSMILGGAGKDLKSKFH